MSEGKDMWIYQLAALPKHTVGWTFVFYINLSVMQLERYQAVDTFDRD